MVEKKEPRSVIIVGAGASGLMAAISAAGAGAKVTILEKMKDPAKKLLLTGNGRCNLTNLEPQLPTRYHSENQQEANLLIQHVFEQFSVADTLSLFHAMGLATTDRDGYVYPASNQATSVKKVLLRECARLGVKIRLGTRVTGLTETPVPVLSETKPHLGARSGSCPDGLSHRWLVETDGWQYEADAVILSCGGCAAPQTGSDGTGFVLAKQLGHTIIPQEPALTALLSDDPFLFIAANDRCRAEITLFVDGAQTARERGELQWTKQGISGVAVFCVSRHASRALSKGRTVTAELDLLPDWPVEELTETWSALVQRYPLMSKKELLEGFLPERTAQYLIKKLDDHAALPADPDDPEHRQRTEYLMRLAALTKNDVISITGTRDLSQSQTSIGGVSLTEVDPGTLESNDHSGLYFTGELLDVDGPCGGYNLQWAWSSGWVAGKYAGASSIPLCGQ